MVIPQARTTFMPITVPDRAAEGRRNSRVVHKQNGD